jgi:hypothetical protein
VRWRQRRDARCRRCLLAQRELEDATDLSARARLSRNLISIAPAVLKFRVADVLLAQQRADVRASVGRCRPRRVSTCGEMDAAARSEAEYIGSARGALTSAACSDQVERDDNRSSGWSTLWMIAA